MEKWSNLCSEAAILVHMSRGPPSNVIARIYGVHIYVVFNINHAPNAVHIPREYRSCVRAR